MASALGNVVLKGESLKEIITRAKEYAQMHGSINTLFIIMHATKLYLFEL